MAAALEKLIEIEEKKLLLIEHKPAIQEAAPLPREKPESFADLLKTLS